MRNQATGLDYANTDPSLHCNGVQPRSHERWFGAWIWCLRHGDHQSAELIRSRNAPQSDECAYQDHDLCRYLWCKCACHSRVQFELEHPQLKSLSEVASELEEMEYV